MTIQGTLFGAVQYSEEDIEKVRLLAAQQDEMNYRHSSWMLSNAANKMESGQPLTLDELFEVKLYGVI